MKYTIRPTSRFQKDLKRIAKRGYDTELLSAVIKKLANGEPLEQKHHDHMAHRKLYRMPRVPHHAGLAAHL